MPISPRGRCHEGRVLAVTRYRYRAADASGRLRRGAEEATRPAELAARLAASGLVLLEARAVPPRPGRAASRRELAVLFQSLASLVRAGVPVVRALAASAPLVRGPLRARVHAAGRQLAAGQSLAHALDGGDGLVPAVVLGLLRAGERGSQLGVALEDAAAHLEREAALVARVRQALAYPLLLLGTGAVAVGVLVGTVIPRFAALLGDMGGTLPAPTRLLLALSAGVTRYAGVGTLTLLLGGLAAGQWLRQPRGRLAAETLLLRLPAVGPVRLALGTARAARALGSLLGAGVPLLPALDAAGTASGNPALVLRLRQVRAAVAAGGALAPALAAAGALSPSALQLIGVGESSGELAAMCLRAAALAEAEAERALTTLVSLLEPALILLFGGGVAFVAAALLQAVYALRPA